MRLFYQLEGAPEPAEAPRGGAGLAAFMSFAVSSGFGASHPLIALAERLKKAHGIPLGPLTTFYDVHAEDAEDREKQDLTWQPAHDLGRVLDALATALRSDPQCQALVERGGAGGLAGEASALAAELSRAPVGARVRLGYEL